jgi:hypothetical protein
MNPVASPSGATAQATRVPSAGGRRVGDRRVSPWWNQVAVLRQILTSRSIKGTSIRTPTTVASDAPEASPKSMTDVAIATSKWLEAPIRAEGAASR